MHENGTRPQVGLGYFAVVPVKLASGRARTAKRYVELQAWQACHAFVLAVYRATESWPKREQYGLTSQIRRASVSAATNIVEGSAKQSLGDFLRYLDIAIGSLAELDYLLTAARDVGLLAGPDYSELEILRDHAGKLTWGLYRSLRKRERRRRLTDPLH